jgi:hypothetical protein
VGYLSMNATFFIWDQCFLEQDWTLEFQHFVVDVFIACRSSLLLTKGANMVFKVIQENIFKEVRTRQLREMFKARKYEEEKTRRDAKMSNVSKLELEDLKRLNVATLNDADFIVATLHVGNRFGNSFEYYYDDIIWQEKYTCMKKVLEEPIEPEVIQFLTQPVALKNFPAFQQLFKGGNLTYGDMFREHADSDEAADQGLNCLALQGDNLYERPNPLKFETSYWPVEGTLFSAAMYIKRWEHDFEYTKKIREKRGGGKPDITELEANYDLLLFDLLCVKALRHAFKSKDEYEKMKGHHVTKGLKGLNRRLNLLLGHKVIDMKPRVLILQEVLQKTINHTDSIGTILEICNQVERRGKWPTAKHVVQNEMTNQRYCAAYNAVAEMAIVFNDLYEKEDVTNYLAAERIFEVGAGIDRPSDGFLLFNHEKRRTFAIRLDDQAYTGFLKLSCCKESLKKMFALELHDCVVLAIHCKRWKGHGEELIIFLDLVMLTITKWTRGKPVIVGGNTNMEYVDIKDVVSSAKHRKIEIDCKYATAMHMKTIFQCEQEKNGVLSCSAKDHIISSPPTHGIAENLRFTVKDRNVWFDSSNDNERVEVVEKMEAGRKVLLPSNIWPSNHCMVYARMIKGFEDDSDEDDSDDALN